MLKAKLKKLLVNYFPKLFGFIKRYRFENHVLPKEFMRHINNLTTNDVVIDLGANVGLVSEAIARTGAKVIAFEPNSSAFAKLQLMVDKYPNIQPYNLAAGVKNQQIKLYLHENSSSSKDDLTQASSLLDSKPNVSRDIFEKVDEINFSEFLQSLNERIEFIKMDIEGYEIQLLNHMLDTHVLDNVGKIYVETHERKFKDLVTPTEALKARIKAEGYENKFFYEWH